MKRSMILILLLVLLVPAAYSIAVASEVFWVVNGQAAGKTLAIEDGETAIAASPAFDSNNYQHITVLAELRNEDTGQNVSVLDTVVDMDYYHNLGQYAYLETEVNSNHYQGPGTYTLVWTLDDSHTTPQYFSLDLDVLPGQPQNTCPVFSTTYESPRVLEMGAGYEIRFLGVDAEGDPLVYTIDNLPPGASWTDRTYYQEFYWAPVVGEEGVFDVTFGVHEQGNPQCGEQVTITFIVENLNPCNLVFDDIEDQVTDEGGMVYIPLYDYVSEDVEFSSPDMPLGSVIDQDDIFIWLPQDGDDGEYDVTFVANAGPGCVEEQVIHITVNDVNIPNECPVADFLWQPLTPDMGETVTFTSTSDDVDNGPAPLSYAWTIEGQAVSNSDTATWVFNQAGNHDVTLSVSDGDSACDQSVTHTVEVVPQCIIDVESINCFEQVVEGQQQACTVHVESPDGDDDFVTVDVYYSDNDHTYAGMCETDPLTGSCTARFTAPAPGEYTVHAWAYKNGCIGDYDSQPEDAFVVYEEVNEIHNLGIFNDAEYTTPDYDYLRAQDLFVQFQVLDPFQNPMDGAVTSVELISPAAGGQVSLQEHPLIPQSNGYYHYFVQIPSTHEFIGPSQVFVFQFNFEGGLQAQRTVAVNINNNPPEIAFEGTVDMQNPLLLNQFYQVTLNMVDTGLMTATFTVGGETVDSIMEGYSYTLSGGMTFHVHDIDFDNNAAVVSITADNYFDMALDGAVITEPTSLYLEQFESDVEDSGDDLDWFAVDIDPAIFDAQWDTELNTLTLTPLAAGTDTFTLELWDLDGAIDTYEVTLTSSGAAVTECNDGLDNDGDGDIDLADPDCNNNPMDDSESSSTTPECSDGLDNDGDGFTDFGSDPDCQSPSDDEDVWNPGNTECSDGLDNDGDGDIDLADPDCNNNPMDDSESSSTTPECSDGLDNDGDGFTDFGSDPDCQSPSDDEDVWNPGNTECSDGLDNDGDLLFDLDDPDCNNDPMDDDESNTVVDECSDGQDNDGDGFSDAADPACILGRNTESDDPQCFDGIDNDNDNQVDYLEDDGCSGIIDDNETDTIAIGECADGQDNDGDGLTDELDPACILYPGLGDESLDPECSDNLDNDGDTLTDWQQDPSCEGNPLGLTESNDPVFECNDNIDNDGDNLIDELDPDCESPFDNTEETLVLPTCSDNLDNDGDGYTDMDDPDCQSIYDDEDEWNPGNTACSDGVDNDGDNDVDMDDLGCDNLQDDSEVHVVTACSDGLDNDGDGRIDLVDPDCTSWQDETEYEPLPQCSDFMDNDHDGLIDMYDPDCSSPSDNSEYPVNPECADGLDNDGDGAIDLADPHCYDLLDSFEGEIHIPAPEHPWSDRDDLLITRIDINGFDVEDAAVAPGEYLMMSISLENTLDEDLDELHVRVFLDDYGLWATKTLDLDSNDRETVNMHLDVPFSIDPGVYDLRITASNDDVRRVKYRHLIVV
ncbi:PKD domain-containing protein [Nanoarchaeota archaeon]